MNKGSRILIHSLTFSPDGVSTAYLMSDLAVGLKESGFDVVVLTTTPHYNKVEESLKSQPLKKHLCGLYYTSFYKGILVLHVPVKKYKNVLLRGLVFLYWHVASLFFGITIKKIDLIISPSPPLSIALVSIFLSWIKRARFIYNVQEVYPDLLINHFNLKSKYVVWVLKKIEKLVYKKSDLVTTIDEVFYNQIVERFSDRSKLKIIPNFVDVDLYQPVEFIDNTDFPYPLCLDELRVRFLYAGNIGIYQDWTTVLYAANELRGSNIDFIIVGDGIYKEDLIEEIKIRELTNIYVLPYQQRSLIPMISGFVDAHFITISEKTELEGFPSKVYTSMACAKPLIVVAGKNTPIYNFLKNIDCAILVSDNREVEFLNAVRQLSSDIQLRERLGNNGLQEIKHKYTKKIVVDTYLRSIEKLL